MKARHKRLALVLSGLLALGAAAGLVLVALDNNLSYFFAPSEVLAGQAPKDRMFRLGGLVERGSLQRSETDLGVSFVVTDGLQKVKVHYTGILPDLFAEGQGMIAQGRLNGEQVFIADKVLAKHDETYMPPEVAETLQQGHREGAEVVSKSGQ